MGGIFPRPDVSELEGLGGEEEESPVDDEPDVEVAIGKRKGVGGVE
jgi:hypothetical protein